MNEISRCLKGHYFKGRRRRTSFLVLCVRACVCVCVCVCVREREHAHICAYVYDMHVFGRLYARVSVCVCLGRDGGV